jgi:tetratricopeptide (TPR) repeat protein
LSGNVHVKPAFTSAATKVSRWWSLSLFGVAGVLFVLLFSGEIRDFDIFWHLRTGQYIVETHKLPYPDPFSYTSTGSSYAGEPVTRRFNLTHEWLSQVAMYAIYALSGFAGLVTARVLMLIVFCALAGWISYIRSADLPISVAAALAAAGMVFYFAQSRPYLVTFVCLGLTMLILETRRRLWLLPALFLVWANCHSGFVLGWIVCGAYIVTDLRRFVFPCAAAICASLLNPNGIRVLQVLWFYRASGIQTTNLEWQRPIFWQPNIYSLLLFGSLLVLLISCRKVRLSDWLLYFSFAAISLMAVRNTVFMGLVGPILIASYLPRRWFVGWTAVVLSIAALAFYDIRPALAAGNTLAFRVAAWQLPDGAASFIRSHRLGGRLFNTYEDGGYLIWRLWPANRVFIDGRGLSEQAFADYRRVLYDETNGVVASQLLDRYQADLVLIEGFDYLSGQVYPIAANPPKRWGVVYADDKSVLLRRDAAPAMDQLALLHSLDAQCAEHIRHDPSRPRCAFGLGELYARRDMPDSAREWISRYLSLQHAPDREAEQMYSSLAITDLDKRARALQAIHDLAGAESLLRQALALAERPPGPDPAKIAAILNNLATALEGEEKYPEAESCFRRSLELCEKNFGASDPRTAMALDNLAGALEEQGELSGAEPLLERALSIAQKSLGAADPTTETIRKDLIDLRIARNERSTRDLPR